MPDACKNGITAKRIHNGGADGRPFLTFHFAAIQTERKSRGIETEKNRNRITDFTIFVWGKNGNKGKRVPLSCNN